ncbi:Single-stranded DNA-binding protein [Caenorhabditis elegans]|uniref:Single-stranded DNA-binding protein n=1 Tax=Caenorhabditis elegans TaxID=6239 RepID=E2JKZ9_CAEEL|nr:Single-stranded DNA-binding protein [Caenorhabditis elegans]CBX25196.1 Single-stranded DNA-binding protein [Caenorhabditis elegans]|eukprot:NP_001256225.1 Uncharacterized protein CELE_F25D1.8 [Caenorhabditis elegans]
MTEKRRMYTFNGLAHVSRREFEKCADNKSFVLIGTVTRDPRAEMKTWQKF